MVTKGELGRPVERLREQMEKLQLHSAKVVMLEQQLTMAEERVRRLEGEKQEMAEQAERSVSMHLLVAFLFTLNFQFITESSIVFFCTNCWPTAESCA